MSLSNDQRERLSAYLDDEVTPHERAEIDAWLASDPAARAELESLRRVARAVGALPRAAAGSDLADRVISQVEREALLAHREKPRTQTGQGWLVGLSAAAVVLLAVTIALRSRARVSETAREDRVLTVADAEDKQPLTAAVPEPVSRSGGDTSKEVERLRVRFDSASRPVDLAQASKPYAVTMTPSPEPKQKAPMSAGGLTGEDDPTSSDAHLYQLESDEAAMQRPVRDNESAPAIRAMARAEDRDEILYRLYQFVEASPSAEFVEADVSEMALLIPGLDWLFLGLPVGGTSGGNDQIEIALDEADVPELLAVLQPIAGTRYELRASQLADAPVTAGRVVAQRGPVPQKSSDRPPAGSGGPPAESVPAAYESQKPVREFNAASQPAASGNLFGASRRVRVVIAFQPTAESGDPAAGANTPMQPAEARP